MAPFHIEKPVTLTIEQEDGATLRYVTPNLTFHMNNGRYNELTASHLTKLSYEPLKEAPVPTEAPANPETGLTKEQEAGLAAVLQSAKGIERTKFVSARAVERAVMEADMAKAAVQHDFNVAVLEGLHAGLTQDAIDGALDDAGFGDLTEKVGYIGALDMSMLYATEA